MVEAPDAAECEQVVPIRLCGSRCTGLVVTIEATNYGSFGAVIETLPDGFTYDVHQRCGLGR